MATLLVGAALQGSGAGLFTKIGLTLLAGYVDNRIAQSVFKVAAPEGQRVNDLQVQNTKEGSPANRILGKRMRVAGTVVWMPRTREVKDKQKGGKSGSNSDYLVYRQYGHVGIELARTWGQPVKGIEKLYTNGKLFYDANPDVNFSSAKIEALLEVASGNFRQTTILLTSDVGDGGVDLSQLVAGRELTMSGWTNGVHALSASLTTDAADISGSPTSGVSDLGEDTVEVSSTASGWLRAGDSFRIASDATSTDYFVQQAVYFNGNGSVHRVTIQPPLQDPITSGSSLTNVVHNAEKNNGTLTVVSSGYDDRTDSAFCRVRPVREPWGGLDTVYNGGSKAAGDTVVIEQILPLFSTANAKAVRFHLGAHNQAPDPLIVEYEEERVGTGNVQAYTDRAVAVIEDMELSDFGNFLPQVEAVVEVGDDDLVRSALLEYLCEDVGLAESEFNLDAVPDDRVLEGYVVRGVQDTSQVVAPVSMLASLLPVDNGDGVVRFLDRANLTRVVVEPGDLGAYVGGPEGQPFLHSRADDVRRIDRVWVEFFDPANDFKTANVPASLPGRPRDQATITLNAAIDRDQGTQFAEQTLDIAQAAAGKLRFSLPPSYAYAKGDRAAVTPGVVCNLGSHFGKSWLVLVDKMEEGANGLLLCEGDEYDEVPFTQDKTGMTSGSS